MEEGNNNDERENAVIAPGGGYGVRETRREVGAAPLGRSTPEEEYARERSGNGAGVTEIEQE